MLFPLEVEEIAFVFTSMRWSPVYPFLFSLLLVLASGYMYEVNNVYEFVSQYYLALAVVVLLVPGVYLSRKVRR